MSHITSCTFCGSILKDVLSLGMHPHSDLFPKDCDSTLEVYPLNLTRCTACGLYQTYFHLSTSKMFNDDYLYDNSVNLSSRRHWTSLANDLYNRISKVSNKSSNFAALMTSSPKWNVVSVSYSDGPTKIIPWNGLTPELSMQRNWYISLLRL